MVNEIKIPAIITFHCRNQENESRLMSLARQLSLKVEPSGETVAGPKLMVTDQPEFVPTAVIDAPVRILVVADTPPNEFLASESLIYDWVRPDCPDDEVRYRILRSVTELLLETRYNEELTLSRKFEEKYRKTLESTPDAIVIVDSDGKITFVNEQAIQLFGYASEEMIGQKMEMLLPEGIRKDHTGYRHQYIQSPKARPMGVGYDLWCRHKDGSTIPVEVSLSPVKTEHGLQIASAIRDISARKKSEEQLRVAMDEAHAANRAKSEFLANMSHELRTPLNAILGYSQILMKDRNLNSQQKDGIEIIRKSGEHLLTLINDILDLSKIESGHMEVHPYDFDFHEFLNGVADIARIRCREKGINFIYEKLSELPAAIHSDEKKLRQILFNLLSNAVKFTDEGGVAFKVGFHEGKIRFQVEDTGVGIPSDKISELFLPFHQVGDKYRHVEGTGLGLAISQRLTRMLGGEILVKSELEKGSIFWIELDLQTVEDFTARSTVDEKHIIGYHGERRRVLIVDDKWENRSVLVNMLSPIGFDIQEARDGLDCLSKCVTFRPDVIFLDLRMPKMDGFEVSRRIRKTRNMEDVVIIAVSASVFEHNREDSMMAGCDEFIAKPFQLSRILGALQDQLGLEWIYEQDPVNDHIPLPSENQRQIPVPGDLADQLLTLARLGDVEAIIELTAEIPRSTPDTQLLIREITRLVKSFDLNRLEKLAVERSFVYET